MKDKSLDLEELADRIIRVEYPTYEQAVIPQLRNAIIRKKQQIKSILEQYLKSVVLGLLREIKLEQEVAKHEHKNDVDRRDYFLGLIHGLNSAESKIKSSFPDIFEEGGENEGEM